MIQIVFILAAILGLLMSIMGGRVLVKRIRAKQVISFHLVHPPSEIEFITNGLYSLSFLECGWVHNEGSFRAKVTNLDTGDFVLVTENSLKPRFRKNWEFGIEYGYFELKERGRYKIRFENIKALSAHKSIYFTRQLMTPELDPHKLDVQIKETLKWQKLIAGIILFVTGVNLAGWGFVLAFSIESFS